RNLNAHIVDDVLWLRTPRGFAERYISGGHHLILSLMERGRCSLTCNMRTLTNYYTAGNGREQALKAARVVTEVPVRETGVWGLTLRRGRTAPCCGIYHNVRRVNL